MGLFALLFKNGTLGHKIYALHSWQATRAKKCKCYALCHQFKNRSKKSYLYFCYEIVFLIHSCTHKDKLFVPVCVLTVPYFFQAHLIDQQSDLIFTPFQQLCFEIAVNTGICGRGVRQGSIKSCN